MWKCNFCGGEEPSFDVAHICTIPELTFPSTSKDAFVEPEFAEKTPMYKLGVMIHGYRLVRTCFACPEQYDVFDDLGQQVAYFRLRHGGFTVDVPDVGGEQVYHANPEGDGIFEDHERVRYLTEAILAVQEYYINRRWYKEEKSNG